MGAKCLVKLLPVIIQKADHISNDFRVLGEESENRTS